MTTINSQAGAKLESVYGTAVVVDRFWPVVEQSYKFKDVPMIFSEAMRATGLMEVASSVRSAKLGATLKVKLEAMTKGFGWFNKVILGANNTTGPTDSAYTHTGTMAVLKGSSFTYQGNFPFTPSGTNQPMTFAGCKITKAVYTFEKGPDGKIMLELEIDAQNCDDGVTSLATASYATTPGLFDWVDVGWTIAAGALDVDTAKLTIESPIKTGDYKQKASALQNEPIDNNFKKASWEIEADFASLTQQNRIRTAVGASRSVAVVATATCTDTGQTIGAATQPSMTFTTPKARFDDIDGIDQKMASDTTQKLKATVMWDESNSPVTIATVNADTTA